jgi:hypothetical protein
MGSFLANVTDHAAHAHAHTHQTQWNWSAAEAYALGGQRAERGDGVVVIGRLSVVVVVGIHDDRRQARERRREGGLEVASGRHLRDHAPRAGRPHRDRVGACPVRMDPQPQTLPRLFRIVVIIIITVVAFLVFLLFLFRFALSVVPRAITTSANCATDVTLPAAAIGIGSDRTNNLALHRRTLECVSCVSCRHTQSR